MDNSGNTRNTRKRLLVVFGTRPEAIKMCPLVLELKKHSTFETRVCVTGQHREMLEPVLALFKITPDYNLDIMSPQQTLFDITSRILTGMRTVLEEYMPDLVFVHGDTSTAFSSALSAFYMQRPVAHVEAGLRTHDIYSPYPEEFNRQGIGLIARLNFSPTQAAADNLLKSGVPACRVYVTGNTGIDAIRTTVRPDYKSELTDWAQGSRLIVVTAHRRENLGLPMHRMFRAIRRVSENYGDVKVVYPVHMNPDVRRIADEELAGCTRIRLVPPMDVLDFHNLLSRSYLVLTDSGGIQEEAPFMGKPVLVMRDTTERPEGVAAGTLRLVGTDGDAIYRACAQLLDDPAEYRLMQNAKNPYGDGTAAIQIANIVEGCFADGNVR